MTCTPHPLRLWLLFSKLKDAVRTTLTKAQLLFIVYKLFQRKRKVILLLAQVPQLFECCCCIEMVGEPQDQKNFSIKLFLNSFFSFVLLLRNVAKGEIDENEMC